MEKQWELPPPLENGATEQIKAISLELKCPPMIAELLFRKGYQTRENIHEFFYPSFSRLHDPFLFAQMEKAVERILLAIDNSEKITIYGDYDVDGTTATALLYLGLKRIGGIVDFFIPHRMIDGYGLSLNSLDTLRDTVAKLIISVDCGVNAIEEIEAINAMGMEIIVTDHHNPKDVLPEAYVIINPKLSDSKYPYPHLAGVGVAFKLLMAIIRRRISPLRKMS